MPFEKFIETAACGHSLAYEGQSRNRLFGFLFNVKYLLHRGNIAQMFLFGGSGDLMEVLLKPLRRKNISDLIVVKEKLR